MSGLEKNVAKIKEAYNKHEDFKIFVDAFATGRRKKANEVFNDAIVWETYKLYMCKKCKHNVQNVCDVPACVYVFDGVGK